ncbi:hypothetical protein RM780_09930 [Streptomyces sp. DSM 44917]|uniref:Uncharacterized protein n=1 Tax=Streptomyces boetiae TaxID=3075541 RepID=A0ABU2L6T4_9ACTN|nr:hypothetical protein [Streptomyces sp. DSM 44917]MDT0307281.1 hypothetical protein [Streptomyces sp. DSM 44917]
MTTETSTTSTTTTPLPALTAQRVALLRTAQHSLTEHPATEGLRVLLLAAEPELAMAADEALIQTSPAGERRLRLQVFRIADHHAAFLRHLQQATAQHALAAGYRLLLLHDQPFPMAADEVLVQTTHAPQRALELRPRHAADLQPGDILHETRVLDPEDQTFTDYAAEGVLSGYIIARRPDGVTHHICEIS